MFFRFCVFGCAFFGILVVRFCFLFVREACVGFIFFVILFLERRIFVGCLRSLCWVNIDKGVWRVNILIFVRFFGRFCIYLYSRSEYRILIFLNLFWYYFVWRVCAGGWERLSVYVGYGVSVEWLWVRVFFLFGIN